MKNKKKNTKKTVKYSAETGQSKKKKEHFERIPDTPENIAKALFRQGKKKAKK